MCLRAQSYAERLRLGLAVMHGEAHQLESNMADGWHSPPSSRTTTGHTGLELPCKSCAVVPHVCSLISFMAHSVSSQAEREQQRTPCLFYDRRASSLSRRFDTRLVLKKRKEPQALFDTDELLSVFYLSPFQYLLTNYFNLLPQPLHKHAASCLPRRKL